MTNSITTATLSISLVLFTLEGIHAQNREEDSYYVNKYAVLGPSTTQEGGGSKALSAWNASIRGATDSINGRYKMHAKKMNEMGDIPEGLERDAAIQEIRAEHAAIEKLWERLEEENKRFDNARNILWKQEHALPQSNQKRIVKSDDKRPSLSGTTWSLGKQDTEPGTLNGPLWTFNKDGSVSVGEKGAQKIDGNLAWVQTARLVTVRLISKNRLTWIGDLDGATMKIYTSSGRTVRASRER